MAMKNLIKLREEIKRRKPKFVRYLSKRYKKLRRSGYRRPKGRHNKMRLRIFGKPRLVSVSYGVPKEVRGLHPSGYEEILVHNIKELESADPKKQAVRIASSVGTKKKIELLRRAEELGIVVLNQRIKRRSWKRLKEREARKKKEAEREITREDEKIQEEKKTAGSKEKNKQKSRSAVKRGSKSKTMNKKSRSRTGASSKKPDHQKRKSSE